MAAYVSPTPSAFAPSYGASRQAPYTTRTRSSLNRRRASPQGATSENKPHFKPAISGDSSDDDDLAPIKLSAEAQAILGEENTQSHTEKEDEGAAEPNPQQARSGSDNRPFGRRSPWEALRSTNPSGADDGSPAPRVVRVASGTRPQPPSLPGRDGSFFYKTHDRSTTQQQQQQQHQHEIIPSQTPAQTLRKVRVSDSRRLSKSPPQSRSPEAADEQDLEGSAGRKQSSVSPPSRRSQRTPDDEAGVPPSTIVRPRRGDENGAQSTMRVRRIGGALLHKPVRRGMVRRHSEDDDEDVNMDAHDQIRSPTPEIEVGRRAKEEDLADLPDDILASQGSPRRIKVRRSPTVGSPSREHSNSRENVRSAAPVLHPATVSRDRPSPTPAEHAQPTPALPGSLHSSRSSSSQRKPIFKIPPLPDLTSAHDQENEPPPTFRRTKPTAAVLEVHEDSDEPHMKQSEPLPQHVSPSRQPLAPRSNNTPRRQAPVPPPKMSILDAATSNAGSRKQKSVQYVLNGRAFRRLDCIGRGGSSRVFRVMADNFKIFALKRVNLEEADMATIAGFKGEIDLLKKLQNVDRVVRLYDYEVNEDKGVLSVMMELGETDFNKMLNEQTKTESAKLDMTFTRHYWKEMLECVQAVHDHDIVHSDLKPANFLLVKGQLKLIDFGIANAIQDDTVNVHRENQIGTPNYMSPESLISSTPAAGSMNGSKDFKLGKPSDVWSLGCILYQMTYGQPPFAHFTKQLERIMAIPNPKVEIQFPATGIGGVVVPFGLIKTLKRCLTREQSLRPTIKELLSDADPFLNPVAISPDMLGRVIGNVVGYCRRREQSLKSKGELTIADGVSVLPTDEDMKGWPYAFYEKLKQAHAEGTAW